MNRDQKAAVVDEIAGQLKDADAVFAIDYRGISVSQVAALRARLRDADATFRIVKNSLTERAADQAGVAELKELLEGPTALTLVTGDPALAAKALNDTSRELQLLEFKGGLLDGNMLSADEIRSIARLPSRDVLHGQLVGTIAAPLSGLVRTLNALISGLAVQLGQIAEQELVSGEAPAPTAEPTPTEDASSSEAGSSSETDGGAGASDATASDEVASPEAPPAEAPPASEEQPEAEADAPAPASPATAEAMAEAAVEEAAEAEAAEPDAAAEAPEAEAEPEAAETEAPEAEAPAPEAEPEAAPEQTESDENQEES
jgi:large subunit ribosomal protein L10